MTGKNKVIAFSGLDGAGKSTQIAQLTSYLEQQGQTVVYLWVRGGYTPLFNLAKKLLRQLTGKRVIPTSGKSDKRTQTLQTPWKRNLWLIIAIVDMMLVYGIAVRWWGLLGRTVIYDRFLDDTKIDFDLNFAGSNVETWLLWRILRRVAVKPDNAFMLLIPVEESQRRSKLKNEPFPDSAEVLTKRLETYEQIGRAGAWTVIDAQQDIATIQQFIRDKIDPTSRGGA